MKRNLLVAAAIGAGLAAWLIAVPPQAVLDIVKRVDLSDPIASGERTVAKYACRDCHRIGGDGALKGPDLSGVTDRLEAATLRAWLTEPARQPTRKAMPDLRLSSSEAEAIIAYLEDLDDR